MLEKLILYLIDEFSSEMTLVRHIMPMSSIESKAKKIMALDVITEQGLQDILCGTRHLHEYTVEIERIKEILKREVK